MSNFDFLGTIDNETSTMSLLRLDGHVVLTLTFTGTLTLFGPDGSVLRSYEEAEVEARQHEIDKEAIAAYDAVYDEPNFGLAVIQAFSSIGDALESLSEVAKDEAPIPPSIN